MSAKFVLNLPLHAKEIFAYLKVYFIGDNNLVEDKVIVEALTELLIDLINVVICDTRDKQMPQVKIHEVDVFTKFGLKTQLNPGYICTILYDMPGFDLLMNNVHSVVETNIWDVWVVNKNYMENFGDYRVIQWTEEHIDEEGKYVPDAIFK